MSNLKRKKIQEERLNMFEGDWYQEKLIAGYWYVKHWNGNLKKWQVGQYSPESFQRYKGFAQSEFQIQNNFVKTLFNS
jgi:hypothetical protein